MRRWPGRPRQGKSTTSSRPRRRADPRPGRIRDLPATPGSACRSPCLESGAVGSGCTAGHLLHEREDQRSGRASLVARPAVAGSRMGRVTGAVPEPPQHFSRWSVVATQVSRPSLRYRSPRSTQARRPGWCWCWWCRCQVAAPALDPAGGGDGAAPVLRTTAETPEVRPARSVADPRVNIMLLQHLRPPAPVRAQEPPLPTALLSVPRPGTGVHANLPPALVQHFTNHRSTRRSRHCRRSGRRSGR